MDEKAIERLDKAVDLADALEKLGFHADVIPCLWDGIPILEVWKRRKITIGYKEAKP